MKRVLSLILAISMVMSMFTFSFAGTTLKDVADTEYEAAVEALVELGVVNGYEDGTYRPNQNVSRAEMAKLLVVAAGLEPAAKLAEGATRFADVNGGWASGYINVASEYGYVMGYPDGTFRPDDTVSYAEATTMALRVLGYKSVVESKGTWPTNYIAKAQDLKLLKDITYNSYDDGAARGNVAILIWNMLKTYMWDVNGESEGEGLQYGDEKIMLEVKFPDYTYGTVNFDSFDINDDGEVIVTLSKAKDAKDTFTPATSGYEYFGNDFYTFVPGTEVEVLVNNDDDLLLTMVRTGSDKLVEGIKEDIDDDYDEISGDTYLYAYGLVERKAITGATIVKATSDYIYEVNTSNKNYVKFNDDSNLKYNYEKYETEIFLKDGERATVEDVKVGDVLTHVYVYFPTFDKDTGALKKLGNAEEFYMIGSSEVEGKLTKVVVDEFDNGADGETEYVTATIAKEEYPVADEAKYVEDPDKMKKTNVKDFDATTWDRYKKDMNGEEVTAVLDVFGRVTMVLFDGKIDAGKDSDELTVKFLGIAGSVERDGGYMLPVVSEDGEDTLTFASKTEGNALWKEDTDIEGQFTIAVVNEDGELEGLTDLDGETLRFGHNLSGDILAALSGEGKEFRYGDESDEKYTVKVLEKATFNDDKSTLDYSGDSIKVGSSTTVVTLVFDDKGTAKTSDDEYRVEYSEGISEIDNMKNDLAVVITDNSTKLGKAKYVVIFDEIATGEDDLVGILVYQEENRIGDILLTVADTRITDKDELKEARKDAMILNTTDTPASIVNAIKSGDEATSGEVVALLYSTEVNKDDELEITVQAVVVADELMVDETGHAYIPSEDDGGEVSDDGREAVLSSGDIVDLDDKDEDWDKYRFIIANVELDDDDRTEKQYVISSLNEVDFEEVELDYLDRISVSKENEIVVIYRGFAARP